ncbi:MAG: glucosaminidase domain-containing protein [Candidatus Dormibacteria bacterium]
MPLWIDSRRRGLAVLLLVLGLAAISLPAAAAGTLPPAPSAPPSPGGAAAQLQQARQQAQDQLQRAQQNASTQDSALAQARADLAAARERLAALGRQIDQLDREIDNDTAEVARLHRQADHDRLSLGAFVRLAYEGGLDSSLTGALAADTVSSAMQRAVVVHTVSDAMQAMVQRIAADQAHAQRLLGDGLTRRDQVAADEQQTQTLLALVQVEEGRVQDVDFAAHRAVTSWQTTLVDAVRTQREYLAAQAALLAERARRDLVFPVVPGVTFAVDTDLTLPSGETAARLDAFLRGTALHDLGGALLVAEQRHHVSARYLLAHAIEESAFGTSQIALQKHNLFGYGANDANPNQDAVTFDSFASCIDAVAAKVAEDYLSASGQYFHGPTLRGMNVNYATDPRWAANIARIGDTFA